MRKIASHVRGHFVAYLALFFALGGTSMAAVNALPKNSVGSSQIKNGSIQKVDISKRTVSSLRGLRGPRGPAGATGAAGSTGATGATGAPGAKGDKGDPGTPATALWAVVGSDGSTARSSAHVVSTAHAGATGGFEVIFDQNVSNCAFIAALGGTTSDSPVGEISATRRVTTPNGVFVFTLDDAGTGTYKPFHLAVFC